MTISAGKNLLMVWHSRTGASWQMTQAALRGAQAVIQELQAANQLNVVVKAAGEADVSDLLAADAYLFCAPENLASLSGEMKEFFDRTYYGALEQMNGRPYGLMISAGTDGTAAARQAERICTGWRLQLIAPALVIKTGAQTPEAIAAPKTIKPEDRALCETLGGTLAALLL